VSSGAMDRNQGDMGKTRRKQEISEAFRRYCHGASIQWHSQLRGGSPDLSKACTECQCRVKCQCCSGSCWFVSCFCHCHYVISPPSSSTGVPGGEVESEALVVASLRSPPSSTWLSFSRVSFITNLIGQLLYAMLCDSLLSIVLGPW
jgi:hypothetical protein